MRRFLSLAVAGVFALLFSAQAQAQTYTFTADLSGASENPGVVTGSGGTATVTLNATARTVSWVIDVYNLPSGVTASHIHAGGPGVNGPVVINFTVRLVNSSNDFRISGSANLSELVPRAAQGINSCRRLHSDDVDGGGVRERALDGQSRRRDPRPGEARHPVLTFVLCNL